MPARPSVLRPALLAAAILALLALVALASRSDRHAGPIDPETRTLPAAFWDYFVTFGLLAAFVLLAFAFYLKVPLRPNRKRGHFSFIQLLALMIIASLIALAGTRPELSDLNLRPGAEETSSDRRTETTPDEESAQDSRSLRIRWGVFFATVGLLVVGAGVFAARRRRNVLTLAAPDDAATALSAALDESVDDLRAERDARRAVIAAYARMERALEGHGFPRFRAEAPLEYLARVLRELRVRSGAVLALTELFERAKFSVHEIDADMKDEAIGALIAVRDDVRGGAALRS